MFVFLKSPTKVDSVVFFGPQVFLFCFLRFCLVKNIYLDIRDWHPTWKCVPSFFKSRVKLFFISSPAFAKGLDLKEERVVVSHNCWSVMRLSAPISMDPIRLDYIGSIRDKEINVELISALMNSEAVQLGFHGDGEEVEFLASKVKDIGSRNVTFTGAYPPEIEAKLYQEATIVNSIVSDIDFNSSMLLPNRLYNSVLNTRPVLVLRGTYLSELVETYGLGLVVGGFDDIEERLMSYFSSWDSDSFGARCDLFISLVEADMRKFYNEVSLI